MSSTPSSGVISKIKRLETKLLNNKGTLKEKEVTLRKLKKIIENTLADEGIGALSSLDIRRSLQGDLRMTTN